MRMIGGVKHGIIKERTKIHTVFNRTERIVIIMKKLGIVMGIALAALTLVSSVNPTTADAKAKYVTTKQAGKKIVALQKKAYKSKKKVSTTFKFKAKSENIYYLCVGVNIIL